jgi:hypothetical protein
MPELIGKMADDVSRVGERLFMADGWCGWRAFDFSPARGRRHIYVTGREWPTVEGVLPSRPGAQRNPACHMSLRPGVLETVDRIPCPQPRRGQDALASSLEPAALNLLDLKSLAERIAARDPDRQTAEIHIRIAPVNRFNALGTAEIVRVA